MAHLALRQCQRESIALHSSRQLNGKSANLAAFSTAIVGLTLTS
jgi:hypothetical protein